MKKALVVVAALLVLSTLLALVGCGGGIEGTYGSDADESLTIEVKGGDEFVLHYGDSFVSGTYSDKGSGEYSFTVDSTPGIGGANFTGKLNGNTLVVNGSISVFGITNIENITFTKQ
ncbi:MAG: hypothetical protein LBU48_02955 [Coriobacteriales bacterium]|nr:hypothetical protein [Coriobacteriales bacterium]